MTQSPVPAWAIKAPDGSFNRLDGNTGDFTKVYFEKPTYKLTEGYRCVRVEVRECEEG